MLNQKLNTLRAECVGKTDGVYGTAKCLYSIKNKQLYRVVFDFGIMFESVGNEFIPCDVPKNLTRKQAIMYITKN